MAPRISLALVLHNHQPVGNFGWVIEDVYRQAYEPMLGALERHPGVRIGLHYTGPLLDWLGQEHPDALDRIRALTSRGQVEILGGGYYEPILAIIPPNDASGQLMRMAGEIVRIFGGDRPRGAWLAERVWEPSLPDTLARVGYDYTILDDNHLRAASVPEDAMWAPYTTDDQGHRLTLFGTEQGLRYRIPFGQVDDLIAYLRQHATEDGERVGMMGDDGEKFGSWPGTYEHCWGETRWVDRCFEALEANADWLTTTTPTAWLADHAPQGRIYVPTASYLEMTEWALPPEETRIFAAAIETARREGRAEARYLRGGFWRNFLARYREVNDLHKQMHRTSRKVSAMEVGANQDRAIRHLYRGQSNDCYWHGLFGGVYIVHMRMATLAEVIAAEDLADSTATLDRPFEELDRRGTSSDVRHVGPDADGRLTWVGDYDLDGRHDALLSDTGQVVLVDLDEGAGIGAWDLRASRVALCAVMRRRPEAYHETLRRHAEEARPAGAPEDHVDPDSTPGPKTIHDIVRAKEAGLADRLVYDWHERRSGLVHLLAAPASAGDLAALSYRELGDFVDQAFDVSDVQAGAITLRRPGHLFVADGPHELVVEKHLRLGGDRLAPTMALQVSLENTSRTRIECWIALESNFNLMGGGHNPAAFYETDAGRLPHDTAGGMTDAGRAVFGNDDAGLRIDAVLSEPARAQWFPIETVSNSEAGFERIYQGSCLTFQWPVSLEPAERRDWSIRFEVRQSRDLTAEELDPAPVSAVVA